MPPDEPVTQKGCCGQWASNRGGLQGQGAELRSALLAWIYMWGFPGQRLCHKEEGSAKSLLPVCYLLGAAQPGPSHGPDPPGTLRLPTQQQAPQLHGL